MNSIKKILSNYTVVSVICIVLGIALVAKPGLLIHTLAYAVGGLIVGYGLVQIFTILRSRGAKNLFGLDFITEVIVVLAGLFIIARPAFIPKVLALIFGVYMVISGLVGLKTAASARLGGASMVISGIVLIGGLALLANPFILADTAIRILGICLIISGAMNFVSLRKNTSLAKHKSDGPFIDV